MSEFNGSKLVIKNTSGSSSHVFNLPTSHSHRQACETYKLIGKCDYLLLSMQTCCYSSPRFCFEKISNLQKNFRENKINTQIFSSRFTFLSLSVPFSLSLSLSLSLCGIWQLVADIMSSLIQWPHLGNLTWKILLFKCMLSCSVVSSSLQTYGL